MSRTVVFLMRRFALALALVLAASGARALDFKPYGRSAFAELVRAHAGRPLMVHFWSVACPPCLVELPQWAKLVDEKKRIDVIFVNVDDEDDRARAGARAEKAGLAKAAHYAFADSFVEKLYFEVDRMWRGELPFTALVAPDGGVVTVTGAVDDPLVTAWLKKQATE